MTRRAGLWIACVTLVTLAGCRSSLPPEQASRPASELLRDSSTRAALTDWFGERPHACLGLDALHELCEWRITGASPRHPALAAYMGVPDQVGVMCVLPRDGSPRAAESCTLQQRRSNRDQITSPGFGPRSRGQTRSRAIQERTEQARRHIEGARDVVAMSRALGHLPERCEDAGDERRCVWRLSDQSFGHGSVARLLGVGMHRKIAFTCSFPADGRPRRPDSCDGHAL